MDSASNKGTMRDSFGPDAGRPNAIRLAAVASRSHSIYGACERHRKTEFMNYTLFGQYYVVLRHRTVAVSMDGTMQFTGFLGRR